MADLATLQQQLNSDPVLRAQFMKEPASFLQMAGLQVLPAQAQKLKESFTSLTSKHANSNPGFIVVSIGGR